MANKISYANLKLKTDTTVNTFDFNGNQIEILKYLPIEDKYDLVMITLQKAKQNNIYNPIKLDMYFHLHLVYMYTNLTFTEKQKENEEKIYDTLKSNGFIDAMLDAIEGSEYDDLVTFMDELIEDEMKYSHSASAVLQSIIQDLPANAQAAAEIVNGFDREKYKEVIAFAQEANGGRPINNVVPMPTNE